MTTYTDSSIFFVVAVLLASKLSAATFHYELSPKNIQPGERARLQITIEGVAFEPQVQDDLVMESKHFTVLDRNQELENGTLKLSYEVTAYATDVTLPPVLIQIGPESFSTEATPLTVRSTRAENDEALRPEFGKLSYPIPWKRVLLVLFIATLSFAVIARFRTWFKQLRRKAIPPSPPPTPEEDPMDWLRRELLRLRDNIETGNEPTPVDEFCRTLKVFYSKRLSRPVTAWTTREFTSQLSQDSTAAHVSQLFVRCDAYKYLPRKLEDAGRVALDCLEGAETLLIKKHVHST